MGIGNIDDDRVWRRQPLAPPGRRAVRHRRPFLGPFLVFLVFPIFVLPYIEEKFEVRLQHALPPMHGKVLFYRYGLAVEPLLEQFDRTRTPFVIFEEDLLVARTLRDRGYNVVLGRLGEGPAVVARVRDANEDCVVIDQQLAPGVDIVGNILDEQAIGVENRIKFSRVAAGALAGTHPWHNPALDRTGTRIVGVEREGEVIVEFDAGFSIRADDTLFVCGSTNSLARCQREFYTAGAAPARA